MVQAGKAHDALLFDPDGLFVPELDGRDRAVPGTQTAADAAVLHMEMVRLAHGRIFDAINGLCKPKRHFALHEVASGDFKRPNGLAKGKMEGLHSDKFAFVERSGTMKSPAGTLSDRTVLPKARWRGFAPTSSRLPKKKESIK